MKVLESYKVRTHEVRIVAPETPEEDREIKRIIREVREEEKKRASFAWQIVRNKKRSKGTLKKKT